MDITLRNIIGVTKCDHKFITCILILYSNNFYIIYIINNKWFTILNQFVPSYPKRYCYFSSPKWFILVQYKRITLGKFIGKFTCHWSLYLIYALFTDPYPV